MIARRAFGVFGSCLPFSCLVPIAVFCCAFEVSSCCLLGLFLRTVRTEHMLHVCSFWDERTKETSKATRGDKIEFQHLGLSFLLVLGFLAPGEQLAGSIQQLPLPLAHLDGVDGVIGGDLLDRLAATDRLHGDSGLELRAVGAALAHWWEPRSGAVPRLRG